MQPDDLLSSIPVTLDTEMFEEILRAPHVRIERILSRGHASPASGWYDQAENEWVLVLAGAGRVAFEDGDEVYLGPGQCLNIPAHRRHRVVWTTPDEVTVWLAVFY